MADPRMDLVPGSTGCLPGRTGCRLLGIIPNFPGGANYPFLGEHTVVSGVPINFLGVREDPRSSKWL